MDFTSRFVALSQQLFSFECFWRNSAFYDTHLKWREHYPQLSEALVSLNDTDFEQLDQDSDKLHHYLQKWIPGYGQLIDLLQVDDCHTLTELPPRLITGVPGRKWNQIERFLGSLPEGPLSASPTVIDWCSGKSFLGRAVAHHWQCGLHAVEYQQDLCEAGLEQAKPWVSEATFSCKDVLSEPHAFNKSDFVLALHACGDLHRTLLEQWRASSSQQLALAPCCYHKWLQSDYRPLSDCGKRHDLQLTPNQVHLAVQEMVTASKGVRQQVNQLAEWRMAFDLIQRDLRGVDEYLPTPSLPYSKVKEGAEVIFSTLAEKKQLIIPDDLDFQPYLKQAALRYREFKRLQLVSQGFRRALEFWLVLDLVLFLEEGGCQVHLASFCDRATTPRNLRLLAQRG